MKLKVLRFRSDLAKKIEQELTYPGQIKVTVIRENRFIEFAKVDLVKEAESYNRYECFVCRRYYGRAWSSSVVKAPADRPLEDYHIDVVVGNGENAAGGFGITPDIARRAV